jgi:SHS family lactate transporter-like MFS transporter
MHPPSAVLPDIVSPAGPWYRDVTSDQWKALLAAYLGWVLDAFDFTILTFLVVDIQRSFTVNSALAGALGTVTLMFRVAGGIGSGTAADRWGRKLPLMLSILWYSAFAGLGGFAPSYTALFVCRALFGIGMGGVWAAGMPLALEHWPARLRGIASGMLQSGYSAGFMLSAFVYSFLYPVLNRDARGWRAMMWIGVLPSLLVFWIVAHVKESPVWLERQKHLRETRTRDSLSLARLFTRDLIPVTLQTSLMMGAFLTFYYSITFWYATYIGQETKRSTLPYLVALNFGTMMGNLVWGRLSETSVGRRGAATIATVGGIALIPLYLFTSSAPLMILGALAMGVFGAGNFGVIPTYLNERFPTAVRAAGAGFAYHVGAGIGSFTPTIVGSLHDRGVPLNSAMAACIAASGILVVAFLRLGPETRGRSFDPVG